MPDPECLSTGNVRVTAYSIQHLCAMKKTLPIFLSLIAWAAMHMPHANAQVTISSVSFSNATSCTNTMVTVTGLHYCANYLYAGSSVSVSGSNITVSINYTAGSICLPAIVTYTQTASMGSLSSGTYNVTVNTYLNNSLSNTSTGNSVTVTSCCSATSGMTYSSDSICIGDSVLFTSTSTGQSSQAWLLNSAQYSTDSTSTVNFPDTGTYLVQLVAYAATCSDTQHLQVHVLPNPEIELGNDTTICEGTFAVFQAPTGFDSYLWSNGSTGSNAALDSIGTLSVTVTNTIGCVASDTVSVLGFTAGPQPDLGGDAEKCPGTTVQFDAGSGWQTVLWSNGATTQTLDMFFTGLVWVEVEDSNGCIGRDSVTVSEYTITPLSMSHDSNLCGQTILYTDDPYAAYAWSTFDFGDSTVVDQSGTYSVTVTDGNGCDQEDSIDVTILEVPAVYLGNDTVICGEPVLLSSNIGGAAYLWNNGSTSSLLSVTQPGVYWLQVTSDEGCAGRDSIEVEACVGITSPSSVWSVYPNPTDGIVQMVSETDWSRAELRVFNVDGALLRQEFMQGMQHQLDLNQLPSGYYLLQIITGSEVHVERLQLMR